MCVDTVGSPTLIEGEGMLRCATTRTTQDLVAGRAAARACGFRNATDGLIALRAGYPTAAIGSVTELKARANYHWPTDTAENVDHDRVDDAVTLCTAIARRLAGSYASAASDPSSLRA